MFVVVVQEIERALERASFAQVAKQPGEVGFGCTTAVTSRIEYVLKYTELCRPCFSTTLWTG